MEDNEIAQGICWEQIVWNDIISAKERQVKKLRIGLICNVPGNVDVQRFELAG